MKMEELMYFNGFGGFSKDGKEYVIKVTKNEKTPLPWSHIIANEKIGTLITSNGSGFTWYGNSRENKLTEWKNDVVLDLPSEKITLEDNNNEWSAYSNKVLDGEEYEVVYGFGYAKYKMISKRYEQDLDVFVTEKPYQKVGLLKIKNLEEKDKKINIKYEIDAVLGVSREYTKKHIVSQEENGNLKIFNRYSNDYSNYNLYMKIISVDNIKPQKIENKKIELNNESTNHIGLEFEIELEAKEEKEIGFILEYRTEEDLNNIKKISSEEFDELKENSSEEKIEKEQYLKEMNFENLGYYKQLYEQVKKDWEKRITKVQVTTPIDSMNIILNGWMIYQTLTSRVWGRASFYQSGGAFGFRDQLQDMLAILYIDPQMVKKQIIYHAKHQFSEGDVLHWWHPERSNGIRTRFSDDLLWLVYVVCEYIEYTADFTILGENIPFIKGRQLKDNEDEIYIETTISDECENLLEHCIRAINKSLDFGEHGLPKMGSGDWNDGMNTVGGESVWLGFFLADIIKRFLTILKDERFEELIKEKEINKKEIDGNLRKDLNFESEEKTNPGIGLNIKDKEVLQHLKEYYEIKYFELVKSLDKAWDGRWFKRAYFKDGEALGSNQNDECKIDNISQSWSVISNAAKKEKQITAMESVENYLVDHENMFIKLLTPAFCNTKMEPGYIKSYIPGVRENGGQYTHGAIWSIIANCKLNKGGAATEYFRMLNPIEHARTKEDAIKYKVEPYVMAADIYSHPNLIGRGGWTWYTGSASWYFVAGVKYILGLNKCGEYLEINPKIPQNWNNCHVKFEIDTTTYIINIIKIDPERQDSKMLYVENGVFPTMGNKIIVFMDNEKCESNKIKLKNDGKKHVIDVKI